MMLLIVQHTMNNIMQAFRRETKQLLRIVLSKRSNSIHVLIVEYAPLQEEHACVRKPLLQSALAF